MSAMELTGIMILGVVLTIVVEAAVFMCSATYRNRSFLLMSIWVNFATNVAMNGVFWCLTSWLQEDWALFSWQVILGEAIVWFLEYLAYGLRFGFSMKLLTFVCLANGVTYGMSLLFD